MTRFQNARDSWAFPCSRRCGGRRHQSGGALSPEKGPQRKADARAASAMAASGKLGPGPRRIRGADKTAELEVELLVPRYRQAVATARRHAQKSEILGDPVSGSSVQRRGLASSVRCNVRE